MNKMMTKARKGATFIEYAMLAGLVAIVVAVAAMFFGDNLKQLFTDTAKQTQAVDKAVKDAKITPNVNLNSGNNTQGTGTQGNNG